MISTSAYMYICAVTIIFILSMTAALHVYIDSQEGVALYSSADRRGDPVLPQMRKQPSLIA